MLLNMEGLIIKGKEEYYGLVVDVQVTGMENRINVQSLNFS